MAGACKQPLDSGRYKAWFMDWAGKQKFFVGTRNRRETVAMARAFEDEHRKIRLGYRPIPRPSDEPRDYKETVDEYVAWGKAQGGRGGRPWGYKHGLMREGFLEFWGNELNLKQLADLFGIQGRVEKILRDIKAKGRAGKTIQNYVESLSAFCAWSVKRGYMENNPLAELTAFDVTPVTRRRALTRDELKKLLEVCLPQRKLLYQVAVASGLRARELASLRVHHLDAKKQGVWLDAEWTKNRQHGFQPLPTWLVEELIKDCESKERYEPLLYLPKDTARAINRDLEEAGIPKHTDEGKIDFHALRVTYVTLLVESGATAKEAQVLARHSTPDLTMNVYAKANPHRMKSVAETVGNAVLNGVSMKIV